MRINIFLFLLIIVAVSCNKKPQFDEEIAKAQILALHNLQRTYHFEKDSIAFANQLSDDLISVNKGIVTTPNKKETISRYHKYFSSVEFVKWDDVTAPKIRFSENGTLAYTVVDKIVKVSYKNENKETTEGETHFAWTAIYKKYGDEWKIDCITSTNKPIESY